MEDKKVSIIMSAYNREKFIAKAIESVLNQTHKNIELVIVDDCSTDNTYNIAESYADKDSRIKLIKHSVNKGAGLTRRTAIDNSTGDFISFVDSDDWIDQDFISTLLKALIDSNSDAAWSPPRVIKGSKVIEPPQYDTAVFDKEHIFDEPDKYCKAFLVGSLSRRLIHTIPYCSLRFIEDTPYAYLILRNVTRGIYVNYTGYNYLIHGNQLTHCSILKTTVFKLLGLIEIYNHTKVDKATFVVRLRQLRDALNNSSKQEIRQYRKELLTIQKYFMNYIL